GGKPREYCVQHNESDFNFESRLLEEDGIVYFFEHSEGNHKLILSDQKNAYKNVEEGDLEYLPGTIVGNQITKWSHNHSFRKGQWSLQDYNFKQPKKNLFSTAKSKNNYSGRNYEHYEYPTLYDPNSGDELVKVRLEA